MLIRTGVDEFSAPARDLVTIFARSRDNNDTNAASYRYNQAPLPSELVRNFPGCQFQVVPGPKVFKGQVAFDTAGAPTAAYDLFQLNNTGQDVPLNKTVLRSQNVQSGFFSFTITGTEAVLAAAPKAKTGAKGKKRAARKPRATRRPRPKKTTKSKKSKKSKTSKPKSRRAQSRKPRR